MKIRTALGLKKTVKKLQSAFYVDNCVSSVNSAEEVLGNLWNKQIDCLSVNPTTLNFKIPDKVTNRVILSIANRLFDPIGFSCPATILPKILIKLLWAEKFSWDDAIEGKWKIEFIKWVNDLKLNLLKIEMPRFIGEGDLSLHVFCDASKQAYAAAVFTRTELHKKININLLSAKS